MQCHAKACIDDYYHVPYNVFHAYQNDKHIFSLRKRLIWAMTIKNRF